MKIFTTLFLLLATIQVNAQLNANIQTVQPPSSSSSCDGWVHIYITSGTAPYTYIWDNLDTTNGDPIMPEYDTLWNVCSGIYEFTVVDANNDSVFLALTFPSAGYTWSGGSGTPQDTAYIYIEECSIDYGIPVDDAYLDTLYYLDVLTPNDTLYYSWAIVQGTDTTYVNDTAYHIQNANNILIDAAIYCNGRIEGTIIQIQHITPYNVGITDLYHPKNTWVIYPNPITSESVIRFDDKGDKTKTLIIFSSEGKMIRSLDVDKETSIDLPYESISSGTYILLGLDGNGKVTGTSKFTK